ncbi:hypothetical protein LPTSP2_17400 [Leptospira ellinghausenii]|uniref:DUF2203 family protein n=1 Tax=Leptospira ellinghausenii TaxID=1917822 RepID=A0A2P2DCU8_9LEPT|nr:DUF2203 domain-containing protein [Leptospira ellinghausenii]GBF42453.1 hypothetical protein LPTSP2_17400 [Leptospira ellinghausenii]
MTKKIWTLEEAREILPLVRDITKEYYVKASVLADDVRNKMLPENVLESKEEEIGEIIKHWTNEILNLKIDVKGLWLVDFDHGNGFYCWTWGEEDVLYEHGYHEGFRSRKLIEENKEENDSDK